MLVHLKKFLPFTINKLGIKSRMDAYEIFHLWNKIMGAKYPDKTKPLSLKKGVLIVGCQNSVLAADLRLQEKKIINLFYKKTDTIKAIRFIC